MKELLLLRHAKSSWDDPALDDLDRPLTARGRKAAPRMGREMAARSWLPDRALVSPALRTRETWDLVAAELPETPETAFVDAIYEAGAAAILSAIRKVPESVTRLAVVGHNPGLEELAAALAGKDSDTSLLMAMRRKFPTAALARFRLGGTWRKLSADGTTLTDFVKPRDLC